jgi:uncharacterized repeat protein (TIGR04076 family)
MSAKTAKVELAPETIKYLKEFQKYTDEQIESMTPATRRVMNAAPKFEENNMIAEVVWAHHCFHQPKPGDKYVFRTSGRFVPEESTHPGSCLWALARFLPFIHIVYDRLAEGLDPSPVGWDHVKCADPGIGCGGCGEVLFKIYCEKVHK